MRELLTKTEITNLIPTADPAWADIFLEAANSAAARQAPCITADEGNDGVRAEAKLIVLRALERLTETKDWIRSETRGPFSISYLTGGRGILDASDLSALAALCASTSTAGMPRGSFPQAYDYDPLFARPRGRIR